MSVGRRFHRGLLWGLLLGVVVALGIGTWLSRRAGGWGGTPLPDLGAVPAFELHNRDGSAVDRDTLLGTPWVADLVFTRCVLICPVMSMKMAALDRDLPRGEDGRAAVRLVSITVDPEHDQPPVLEEFARRYHASDRWLFLTGSREQIGRLAADGLHLGFDPNPPLVPLQEGDTIYHSTKFVLVDALGRVRGYYDSQSAEDLDRLRHDVARLLG